MYADSTRLIQMSTCLGSKVGNDGFLLLARSPCKASVRDRIVSASDVAMTSPEIVPLYANAATSSSTGVGDLTGERLPAESVEGTLSSPGMMTDCERVVGPFVRSSLIGLARGALSEGFGRWETGDFGAGARDRLLTRKTG